MKCLKCSYETENNKFCPNCGTPVNQIEQKDVPSSTSFVSSEINQNIQPIQSQVVQTPQMQPVIEQTVNPNLQLQTPKKKSKVGLILVVVLLIIALVGGAIFVSSKLKPSNIETKPNEQETNPASTTKTFMIYMVGSDLESKGGNATLDILEMLECDIDENVNVLIYTGGAKKWKNTVIKNTENAIYEIKDNNTNKVKEYPIKDMLQSSTLTEFMDYVYDNYESDSYNLILWDHGSGPVLGYGYDEISNSQGMSTEAIKTSISNSKILKEQKIDIIGFDACLMSSIEVAATLSDVANYMVASQEVEPGFGWDYNFLENITEETSVEQIGIDIIDHYIDFYKELDLGYKYKPDLTLSLVNLSKVGPVEEKIDSTFSEISSNITISNYSKISQGVNKATKYADGQIDLIDINGFLKNVGKEYEELNEIVDLVNEAIVYKKGNISGSSGLSIYFPNTKETSTTYLSKYKSVDFSDNYKIFINEYIKYKTGAALVSSKTNSITSNITNTNELSAELPQDLVDNYKSAYYIVYKKEGENAYLPVLRSNDVNINGSTISTKANQKQIIISNKDNTEKYTAMVIKGEEGEEFTNYKVIATLEKIGTDDKEEICAKDEYSVECLNAKTKLELANVYLYYRVYKDGRTPELYDIKPFDQNSELAAKISFDLSYWDYFCFMSSNYQLYDQNGNLLDDWISNGTIKGYEFSLDEGYNISVEDWDKENEYYYQFMVVDTQDNIHQLPLIKAE